MTSSNYRGCPWSVLGIDATAPPEKVREAYRKMALRYHPDLNKGSNKATEQFQAIKDAFEEIQARQEAERIHRSYTSKSRQAGYSSRYRYTNTSSTAGFGSSFQGFRRDRQAYSDFNTGYQDEKYVRKAPRDTTHETIREMRMRMRQFKSAGLGLGVLFAGTTVFTGLFVMDLAWRSKNRGKSFGELMKSLDEKASDADVQQLKKRRRPPPPPP